MIRSYFRFAIKSIISQGHKSIISIAGLSVALSCSVLILLYLNYELSYDRHHKNADNIYRIIYRKNGGGSYMGKNVFAVTPAPLKGALVNEIPEVKYSTRCSKRSHTLEYNNEMFAERGFLYADPDFMKIFTFPVVSGNPVKALEEPFNVFITREMAQKYFGNDNPVGKVISADNKYIFTVAGILENVPPNTHLDFDFLTGFPTLYSIRGGMANVETWGNFSYTTYVQLAEDANMDNVYLKLGDFGEKYLSDLEMFAGIEWILQPLKDIHLGGNSNFDIGRNSDIKYLFLISTIGIFILLIACFNYMNIALARSYNRGREIGILKVSGSSRSSLILQFLTESVILSFAGLILAAGIVLAVLPVFSQFTDRPLNFMMLLNFPALIRIFILTAVVGLIAGLYPAFHLSSLSPINLIKQDFKNFDGKRRVVNLRNMLIILQYCISLVALISTFTIVRQLSFIRDADLGYVKENILTVLLNDPLLRKKPDLLLGELQKNPKITDITTSSDLPCEIYSASFAEWEGKESETRESVFKAGIGKNFIDFYGLKIISGRGYSEDFPSDSVNSIIISHKASGITGWSDPENKKFGFNRDKLKSVIGEVKDFNFQSLHLDVEPLALLPIGSDEFPDVKYISVKTDPGNIKEARVFVEKKLRELSPDYLNPVSILSDRIDSVYSSDRKTGTILIFSTIIAVLLTCFGQYSLSSYTTRERTKEMVVRKVMGSTSSGITAILLGEMLKLIAIAFVFAVPAGYLLLNSWLDNFAFHIGIRADLFLSSLIITILISALAISYHVIKLSALNPAEKIRHE